MALKSMATSAALIAGVLGTSFAATAYAQDFDTPKGDAAVQMAEPEGLLQIHKNMRNDPGIYAREGYLAYIKGPNENLNRLAERGLLRLAQNAYIRTSFEPAGIVGLDIEKDDLSLFPFIYWPVSEQHPPLSTDARLKVQDHAGRGNLIAIDLAGGWTLRTSKRLPSLLNELQVRPLEELEEGHVLTQSFYITEDLPGTHNREVLVERTLPEKQDTDMTAFVIGDQNWAGSWSAVTVGPDIAEEGVRAGLNMIFGALMGTYKLDELHQPTIEQKRKFKRQHEKRMGERGVEGGATEMPAAPPISGR